jgi:ABC-2 type transport system permease protein
VNRTFQIALREFLSTVATKGFIFGVLVTPALIALVIFVIAKIDFDKPPKIDGEVAIIDPTGEIVPEVRAWLEPEALARRRGELREVVQEQLAEKAPEPLRGPVASAATKQALDQALGEVPHFEVVELPTAADVEQEKGRLREGTVEDGGLLALVTIHPDAVRPSEGGELGRYDLWIRDKLDDRIVDEVKDGVREAIVAARIRAAGLDRKQIEKLTEVGRVRATTVTLAGEQQKNEALNFLLPVGFMVLLMVSVFTGGQYLLTTTIEEKSSRVVEVLLSAVSPMQLMTGKIIGQMAVGFVIIALYAGLGMSTLAAFAVSGLVDPWLFVYLVISYLIAYFVVGSFMAAIGAAVNEPREAQSLMTPVMIAIMLPWMLWFWIVRDPNSLFATVASFIPPVNTFVMMLRVTSNTPPPTWQVWLSLAVGAASVWATLWFAAKVFRIGLLLHGKPPNFATLVRWVRMA